MTKEEAVIILDGFKNNPLFSDTHAQAFDMAISALSAEGEYIKKEDILNELGDTNMDILTDEVKEIVNGLPSYSFPDSENKGEWKMPVQDDGMSDPIYYQVRCSQCGFDIDPQTWHEELHRHGADNFCPNCGADMRGEE